MPESTSPCSSCGKAVRRRVTSTSVPICRDCPPLGASHGTDRRYKSGCRCDECRAAWNARCRQHQEAARARGYVRPDRRDRPQPPSCAVCSEPLLINTPGATTHVACQAEAGRREKRRREARAKAAKAARGTESRSAWVSGECAQCLQVFTRKGTPSRFCSKRCSGKAKSTRRRWKIAMRDRLAIYERDAWTCQLCMEPVDPDLMTTDPIDDWAPSLDHIEPQAHALIPDHSPENLRLAHRWCNSVRGDGAWYTEADLRLSA